MTQSSKQEVVATAQVLVKVVGLKVVVVVGGGGGVDLQYSDRK